MRMVLVAELKQNLQ